MKRAAAVVLTLMLAASCGQKEGTNAAGGPAGNNKAPANAPQALATIGQVRGPESVLYDPQQDCYFISNINGGELAADDNGFISRVDPNTMQVNLHWIQAGKNGVHLDGPKGMAIAGDALYVSDVTAVRKFDRRTGAPLGAIPIPGATFINDATSDGTSVYVSDTGLKMGPGLTFIRTNTDAVWKITDDKAVKIAAGPDLKQPNGLDVANGKLWVVTFGANELYSLDDHGHKGDVTTLPKGELDGLIHLGDGTVLVSSWEGHCVYRSKGGGPFVPVLSAITAPADIGYDSKRHRLLVPHSASNEVTVHDLR